MARFAGAAPLLARAKGRAVGLLVVLLAAQAAHGVPRESPDFDPERDVPDMSGSEVVPRADRREAEKGCHWTARLKMELCAGGECEPAEILAFDFQRRAWSFYEDAASALAPPLEEAIWIATMPDEELISSFDLCPGMVITSLFLAAEARFPVGASDEGHKHLQKAKSLLDFLLRNDPEEFDALAEMWPVKLAQVRSEQLFAATQQEISQPSVDIVIARCDTSLRWLWTVPLPPQARLLIYEKCQRPEGELERQLEGLLERVAQILPIRVHDDGHWMTGECGAYLRHLIWALEGQEPVGQLADYTVFIHDDAPRHLKPAFLGLAMQALAGGRYDTQFLNLAHERYIQARTPCLERMYALTFDRPLPGRLSTYCCGHFIVGAERIRSLPPNQFHRLLHAVEAGAFAAQAGGPCEVAHMPCYVVEYIWHVLFGEPEQALWRSEDPRLPLFLRYEGGRSTRLPSPLGVEPYMQLQPHYARV